MATNTDIRDMLYYWINIPTLQDKKATIPGTADKIYNAYNQKGGWESWAQVELAYLIQQKYGADYHITREDGIYSNSQQRSDLVLVSKHNANDRQIIELKCQGFRKDQAHGNKAIVGEVQSDVQKLTKELKPAFRPARCFAIGITCTDAALAEVKKDSNWPDYTWDGQLCKGPAGDNGSIYAFWVETNVA